MSLDRILTFVDFLQQFRAVERKVLVKGSDRFENDGEHSFSLAMLAWYINFIYHLNLDNNKLLKYALAHDLVEVYAGDTFLYTKDDQLIATKEARETEALLKIKQSFPDFSELTEMIENYRQQVDQESKFISALDKLEPIMSIYNDQGRSWRAGQINLEMIKTKKIDKIKVNPTIFQLFEQMIDKLQAVEAKLF